jgi:hypothetical protein
LVEFCDSPTRRLQFGVDDLFPGDVLGLCRRSFEHFRRTHESEVLGEAIDNTADRGTKAGYFNRNPNPEIPQKPQKVLLSSTTLGKNQVEDVSFGGVMPSERNVGVMSDIFETRASMSVLLESCRHKGCGRGIKVNKFSTDRTGHVGSARLCRHYE